MENYIDTPSEQLIGYQQFHRIDILCGFPMLLEEFVNCSNCNNSKDGCKFCCGYCIPLL